MERDSNETKPLSPQSEGHENYDTSVGLLHEAAKSPQSIGIYLTSKSLPIDVSDEDWYRRARDKSSQTD